MSEAIIARGGRSFDINNIGRPKRLFTQIYNSNLIWTVPANIVNNSISVRIFSGGGGGGIHGGGGGGWMNNADIIVNSGETINIVIGEGGKGNKTSSYVKSGRTTFFGNYLSANGGGDAIGTVINFPTAGSGGSGGGSTIVGGKVYQFGGGGGAFFGGDGGGDKISFIIP